MSFGEQEVGGADTLSVDAGISWSQHGPPHARPRMRSIKMPIDTCQLPSLALVPLCPESSQLMTHLGLFS